MMVLAKLKILISKVRIAVFVMIMVLVRMRYGSMKIDFIRQYIAFFGDDEKATQRSPADNLTKWIITQSKDFIGKCIGKFSRSVRAYNM